MSESMRYSGADFDKAAQELLNALKFQKGDAEKITVIFDTLRDIYHDGKVYGQRKAIEDMTYDIKGVLSEFEDYEDEE